MSGGNPQIAKGDGDAPVQAYLEAMPAWKGDIGRLLDSIIVATVPEVHKTVRWNSPFYGIEGNGGFASFHCLTKNVKVSVDPRAWCADVPEFRLVTFGYVVEVGCRCGDTGDFSVLLRWGSGNQLSHRCVYGAAD